MFPPWRSARKSLLLLFFSQDALQGLISFNDDVLDSSACLRRIGTGEVFFSVVEVCTGDGLTNRRCRCDGISRARSLSKAFKKAFQRPLKGLSKAFKRPLKGLLKAIERPLEGLSLVFQRPSKDL
jgi:hypothetical protein